MSAPSAEGKDRGGLVVRGEDVSDARKTAEVFLARYQRCTPRLAAWVGAVVRELAGRASTRVLAVLAIPLSRHSALRALLRLPLP